MSNPALKKSQLYSGLNLRLIYEPGRVNLVIKNACNNELAIDPRILMSWVHNLMVAGLFSSSNLKSEINSILSVNTYEFVSKGSMTFHRRRASMLSSMTKSKWSGVQTMTILHISRNCDLNVAISSTLLYESVLIA